jgi:hypothetical protein
MQKEQLLKKLRADYLRTKNCEIYSKCVIYIVAMEGEERVQEIEDLF